MLDRQRSLQPDTSEDTISAAQLGELIRIGEDGVTRVSRRIYTDPAIFDLEMRHIWERSWIFVAHNSQLPNPGDYVTATIGRQPVIVLRGRDGTIGVFVNSCSHRGATLCRLRRGNARVLLCPYHGWSFSTEGALLAPKESSTGAYPPGFDKAELGLMRVPRMESYKGFIFASFDPDIMPLRDHLGDAITFIDMVADQGASMEVLKGVCTYSYDGNWKLQAENGVDGYHPSTVHLNFIATQKHRAQSIAQGAGLPGMVPVTNASQVEGGYYDFGHGHTMIWGDWANPQDRFNYRHLGEFADRMGQVRANWVVGRLRNLLLYPSVFLMDQQSSQIRVIQPVSVNKTKVTVYCLAPVGEAPAERERRIRYYEDFFNASGMATPDDLSEFNASQNGFAGTALPDSDFSRGAMHQIAGPDRHARELGIHPASSGAWIGDEGVYLGQYRHWLKLLTRGLEGPANV